MFKALIVVFLVFLIAKIYANVIDTSHIDRRIHSARHKFVSENPEEHGLYLEGDIFVSTKQSKSGVIYETFRWSDGVIPYEIASTLSENDTAMIQQAFNAFHITTCLKFIPRRPNDNDYIFVDNDASGCWSSIGRIKGKQEINLESPLCFEKIGTPIHEIAHAVGFYHEQNREDRDDFVTINFENIQPGREKNFDKLPPGKATDFHIGYDYGSVMHYSPTAFSKDERKLRTIEVRGGTSSLLGQREGLSDLDVEKINRMYCFGESG